MDSSNPPFGTTRDDALRAFEGAVSPGTPLTTGEIADALGAPPGTITGTLEALADGGALETRELGTGDRLWWRPTERTERRNAGSAVLLSTHLFERMLEAVPFGVALFDADGGIVLHNATAAHLLGVGGDGGLADVCADPDWTVADETGEPIPPPEWPVERVRRTGEPVTGRTVRVDRPDGSHAWLTVDAALVGAPGDDRSLVLLTCTDVTERKTRERQLRRERDQTNELLDLAPIAIAVREADGSTVRANRRAQELLGLSEAEIVEPPDDVDEWEVLDPDGEPLAPEEAPTARVLATGEPVYDERLAIQRPNGDRLWVAVSAAPLFTPDGDLDRVVTAGEDVTARIRYEEQLAETVGKLRASNERLEQFAKITAHDLAEPLRMISNHMQLLADRHGDALDEDARELVEFSIESAQRLQQMITGLSEYARLETETEPFEPQPCAAVVEDALANLRLQIEETGAEVDVDALPTVVADGNQLTLLFQNLVSNAMKYAGDDPPRVEIGAEERADEWVFRVHDDGIGIDPAYQDRIFEVFKQLHAYGEYPGEGIGLAVCERIVDRHGGRIWVDSTPGEGATFYFTIPAGAEVDARA